MLRFVLSVLGIPGGPGIPAGLAVNVGLFSIDLSLTLVFLGIDLPLTLVLLVGALALCLVVSVVTEVGH